MIPRVAAAWTLIGLVMIGLSTVVFLLPRDSQSGEPVPEDPRRTGGVGLTSYCLPDSRLRVFERPFPSGGSQPLFSVVNTVHLGTDDPYHC